MKTNLPVSGVEKSYVSGTIVSKTDLKGIITHANDAFIEMSGFAREELIGKNHNIVRHPDMPPAAFAWLWDTIAKGKPWRGTVKNRCKNGDHYWVDAFVVPVRKNGKIVEYMSVRTPPSRAQVGAAEAIYQQLNAGMALPKPGILKKLTLRMGMTMLGGFNLLLLAASGVLGYFGEHAANAVLIGVGGTVSLVVGVSLMGNIDGRLKRIIRVFEDIAEGNLNERIEIDGQDELGQVLASLACMQTHLKVILDEVTLASQVIHSRSGDLQHEIREVVAHSQSQSDRVMQVSTAMEQMSGAIRDVAESAKGAAQAAGETQTIVENGNAKMAQSVAATSRVVAAVETSSGTIAELNQSIQKIGEITNTIKEIADQTNLLALNAAIEAARAGEQGRGFAVVADEVRKLAERTASSTADISQMVGSIKTATGAAVQAMSQAGEEVESGLVLIRATGSSLGEIKQASDRVNDMARQIAGAADQQSAAGGDIAGNMEQIAALARENTESIRQVDSAAEVLARVANDLQAMVKHFDH